MELSDETNAWNPMLKAFKDREFNSYRLPGSPAASPSAIVELFVAGIPLTLTETGLRNLLSPVVQVHRINLVQHRGIGFVSVPRKDAVKVIAYFNNYKLGDNSLTVKISSKPKKQSQNEQNSGVSESVTKEPSSPAKQASKPVDELKVPELLYPSAAKHLEVGDVLNVKVSNVVSPSQFWVCRQPHDPKSQLNELHAKMQQHYSSLPPKVGFRPNGSGLYAALMKETGDWYRAQALKYDTTSVLVLLLDFGTCKEVKLTELHALEGQFLTLPFQALCCLLANVQGTPRWTVEAANCMQQLVVSKQVRMKICNIDKYMLSVELISSSGQAVSDVLVQQNYARYVQADTQNVATSPVRSESGESVGGKDSTTATSKGLNNHIPLTVGEQFDVVVLHARNADDATVMLKSNMNEFLALAKELSSYVPSSAHVPQIGEVVVAEYSNDSGRYRAEVLSLDDDDTAVVRFVDFGNYATVNLNSVMKLQPKHLSVPVFGINVRFFNLPENSDLLSEFHDLSFKVVRESGDQYVVKLVGNDSETSESPPIRRRYSMSDVKQLSLKTDRTYRAFVTDGTEVEKFHMHVSGINYTPIEELLQSIYSVQGGDYYPLEAGELVAVHLDEDDSWYRAVVCEIESRVSVVCQLLDFGMVVTATCKNIGQFDCQLLAYPVISFKCWFHDARIVSANSWKDDCLKPMVAVYNLKVVEICDNLHYVELVDTESNVDLKQKLIADGVLVKGRQSTFQSGVSATEPCSSQVRKLSLNDDGRSVKVTADTDPGGSSGPVELQLVLASLSDAEIHQLCQMRESVFIVHANSPSDFYIRSAAEPAQMKIAGLHKSVNNFCNQSLCKVAAADVGQIAGVFHDGSWFRGEVLYSDSNGRFRVQFVDMGMTKTCTSAELRLLPHNLAVSLPRQAIHCAIDRVVGCSADGSWSAAAVKWFCGSCVNRDFRLKFVFKNDSGSIWLVDLLDAASGRTIKQMLIAQKLAMSKSSHSSKPDDKVSNTDPVSFGTSRKHEVRMESVPVLLCSTMKSASIQVSETVTVTYVHSPSKFFIQQQHQRCPKVFRDLNYHCNECTQEYRPQQVGELVGVLENDHWYRAEVLSIGNSTANVHFIDYGNIVVNVDFKHIRVLPMHFATALPKLAVPCAIYGVTGTQGDSTYLKGALRWFRDNYLRLACTVTEARQSGSRSTLLIDMRNSESIKTARELLLDYDMACDTVPRSEESELGHNNPAEVLVFPDVWHDKTQPSVSRTVVISKQSAKFREPPQLDVGASVCIVHVVSPADFYVMPADPGALQEMLSLSRRLSEYCSVSNVAGYSPQFLHEPVAAKFEGEWFRAEVVMVLPSDDHVEVFFVDYGNTEVVSAADVRSLPGDFVEKAKEAVHCGIDGVVGTSRDQGFTQAATEWFKAKFCCGSNASLTFVRISSGRKHMVNFSMDGVEMSAKELLLASGFAKYSE